MSHTKQLKLAMKLFYYVDGAFSRREDFEQNIGLVSPITGNRGNWKRKPSTSSKDTGLTYLECVAARALGGICQGKSIKPDTGLLGRIKKKLKQQIQNAKFGQVSTPQLKVTRMDKIRLHLLDLGDLDKKELIQYATILNIENANTMDHDTLLVTVNQIHSKHTANDLHKVALSITDDTKVHAVIQKLLQKKVQQLSKFIDVFQDDLSEVVPKLKALTEKPNVRPRVRKELQRVIRRYERNLARQRKFDLRTMRRPGTFGKVAAVVGGLTGIAGTGYLAKQVLASKPDTPTPPIESDENLPTNEV